MTKFDQLCLEVRRLRLEVRRQSARIDAMEGRRHQRPRPVAPRPTDAVIAGREKLWAKYLELEMRFGHGRTRLSKLAFAMRHRLNPTEFNRWFSARDKRGIPVGSAPDLRFHRALAEAIGELESKKKPPRPDSDEGVSHGNSHDSQFFGARPQ